MQVVKWLGEAYQWCYACDVGASQVGSTPTLTDGGNNNHIDISSGGTMTLTTTSLYVLGSTSTGNTSVNLGNGTGISTLTVSQTAGYTAGVVLNNANGRLNFNGGRLIAGTSGNLVSGAGQIVLNGAGYISTGFSSTISSAISGSGTLIKEGSGTLTLNGSANTYSGSATISQGTLALTTLNVGGAKTLMGNGSLNGVVNMTNASTFAYEMNSGAVSSSHLLKISGAVSLESTSGNKVYLTLSDLAGTPTAFTTGTTLSLINYASSLSGEFFYGTTDLTDGTTFNSGLNSWTIHYGQSTGGANFSGSPTGLFINLTAGALTAIPEPGSLLALGCLVGSGAFLRSRRRTA